MAQPHNIILSPADSPYHSADAVIIDADCGHKAWIGPTTLSFTLNPFAATRTMCLRCLTKEELVEAMRSGNLRSIPGAKEELAREIGQAEADALYRRMHVNENLTDL